MSLTPEQWAKLDAAEREYASAPYATGSRFAAESRLIVVALPHLRALIDAARPKCQRCGGWGTVHVWDDLPRAAPAKSAERQCPDCDGTGWAR